MPNHPPRGLRRTAAGAALLLLPGCLAAPIDRADRAAEARLAQAAAEARKVAQDAVRAADASVAARIEQVAAEARAARAEALADVDARLTAHRQAVAGDMERVLGPIRAEVAAVREESAAWREIADRGVDESARWREEVASWRTEVGAVRAAFVAPTPATRSLSPGLPAEERYALWAALAGAVFTVAKTGLRLWRSRRTDAG